MVPWVAVSHLGTTDIFGGLLSRGPILCTECLRNILGLYPPDASSTPPML